MYDMEWNATTRLRRTKQKPIGWLLRQHDVTEWNDHVDPKLDEWRTMHDLREVFRGHSTWDAAAANETVTRRHNQRRPRGYATLCTAPRHTKRSSQHDTTCGATSTRYKKRRTTTSVLDNLRHGGWGKKDMTKRVPDMTQLDATHNDGTRREL